MLRRTPLAYFQVNKLVCKVSMTCEFSLQAKQVYYSVKTKTKYIQSTHHNLV